jgi:hypothetical protein
MYQYHTALRHREPELSSLRQYQQTYSMVLLTSYSIGIEGLLLEFTADSMSSYQLVPKCSCTIDGSRLDVMLVTMETVQVCHSNRTNTDIRVYCLNVSDDFDIV